MPRTARNPARSVSTLSSIYSRLGHTCYRSFHDVSLCLNPQGHKRSSSHFGTLGRCLKISALSTSFSCAYAKTKFSWRITTQIGRFPFPTRVLTSNGFWIGFVQVTDRQQIFYLCKEMNLPGGFRAATF